jgi:hypothetical protein
VLYPLSYEGMQAVVKILVPSLPRPFHNQFSGGRGYAVAAAPIQIALLHGAKANPHGKGKSFDLHA